MVQAGGTAQATVSIKSAANVDAILSLASATNTFTVKNDAANDKLAFTDGTNDLMTLARSTGNMVVRGDMTVGAINGDRSFTVQSTSASAINVESGGTGLASLNMVTPSGIDSVVNLVEGTNTYSILNDASAGKLAIRDGSSDLLTVQRTTGNAFIKGTISTSSIGASISGTPKQDADAVVLTNQANAADMDNTRVSLTYKQFYYDATTPAAVAMAKITAGTETDWTSNAASQDAFLSFNLVEDGTVQERMRISSAGNVGIGTTSPTHKLSVAGGVTIREDLLVGGSNTTGAKSVSVVSSDNSASVKVTAATAASMTIQSSTSSAELFVSTSTVGQEAKVVLAQGADTFTLANRGSSGELVVQDGSTDVLKIARSSGNAVMRGSLTVGNTTGARSLTIKSTNANAALNINADTSGAALITATAASGQDSKLALVSGTSTIEVINDGAADQLKFTNGTDTLMSIKRTTGEFYSKGSLTIGTGSQAVAATVKSTGAAAQLSVLSTASSATATIAAAAGSSATLNLMKGTDAVHLVNNAGSGKFEITDGTNQLVTVAPGTGAMQAHGDLTIGGSGTAGAKSLSITSSDSAASIDVTSGGSSAASVAVTAPAGQDASMTFSENGGKSWFIKSKGSHNQFQIGEGSNDWLTIEETGKSTFKEDLTTEADLVVGGAGTTGAKAATIHSTDAEASLSISGTASSLLLNSDGGSSDTSLTLTAQSGRKATLSLVENAGTAFHLIDDGASDTFKINDGTNDLMTIAATSGDTVIRGALNVQQGAFVIDATSGFAGVGTSNPQTQLHVNGSMILDNGNFKVGQAGKFYIDHQNGYLGINNPAPLQSMHVMGNILVERDHLGNGGHLFATTGAVHFKYASDTTGPIDRDYFVSTNGGVNLPNNQDPSCTDRCVPTTSRVYIIRNRVSTYYVHITSSAQVPVYKNGVLGYGNNGGVYIRLEANGMAMCAFNTVRTSYDCYTWNE